MSLPQIENATVMDTSGVTEGRRPVVLVLMEFYLPGFKSGGPLRAISGLTEALGGEFDFKIITSDRDVGDKQPYEGIRRNQWMRVGRADVLYVDRRNPFSVLRHILKTPHDVLYMKSFCSRPFSIWPCWIRELGILRSRSIVLAPCGEFAPGALALKRLKKRFYIAVARRLSIYKRAVWHVTSLYEAADVKRELGYEVTIVTARSIGTRNDGALRAQSDGLRMVVASELRAAGPGPQPDGMGRAKAPGELRAVFLARVARNKNISGALNYLYGLKGNVSLDIYGPLEDTRYWDECQQIIAGLPKNVKVSYRGAVPHPEVHRVLTSYHLLFFPTMGENFGYAISEALQAGCPILISDRTPWRNLEAAGVGWDLPLDQPERFREVLQRCIDMGSIEYEEFSARAMEYGWLHSQNPEIVSQNRKLFETALT